MLTCEILFLQVLLTKFVIIAKFVKYNILMKLKFLTIKKKTIIAIFLCFLCVGVFCGAFYSVKAAAIPKYKHSIVIDVGHGGRDGGAIGVSTGVTESELNLTYAKKLAELAGDFGIKATLTRNDMKGLYDENASNKKKSEMERRKQIINGSGADLMVSIHMNSFPLPSCEGAAVFYAKGSESGFDLAKSVQLNICKSFSSARDYVSVGDYYVINTAKMPAILIECGFLSSPKEEKLLVSEKYCEKFCYSILAGIISYFEM